jgi:hypothetical protein
MVRQQLKLEPFFIEQLIQVAWQQQLIQMA